MLTKPQRQRVCVLVEYIGFKLFYMVLILINYLHNFFFFFFILNMVEAERTRPLCLKIKQRSVFLFPMA